MRILLTTPDLFFLYHPPTPSRSLAVRRPTRVRGVGLGFASREPQAVKRSWIRSQVAITAYHLASPGKCHETISLCHGAPHATHPHQQRQRTRARDARARERPRARAHARTPDAARRCCLDLRYICIIPSPHEATGLLAKRRHRSPLGTKGLRPID